MSTRLKPRFQPQILRSNWKLSFAFRESSNLLAGLGYNGRGVAMSTMMGKLLAERVAGARAEDMSLPTTTLTPIPFHGWRAIGIALAIGWKRLQDRINP